ncbi:unnamed protein product [Heterobilharzia americana]|nr:unnamed protein product [Heterobilharzia americana]
MRKKSSATKCQVDEDKVASEPLNNVADECNATHSDTDSDVVQISPLFLMDSSGHPILQDGTPVVEPEVVNSELEFHSASTRNEKNRLSKIPPGFSPGVMDCVKCTVCRYKIEPFTTPFSVHPFLKVLLCKRCGSYCKNQNFAKDESGKDENCKWCSDGGDLVCCDHCSYAICKKCIKQNLGRTYLRDIESLSESDTWNCFVCDPTPIKALQDSCSEIVAKVAEYEAVRRRRSINAQEKCRSRCKGQPNDFNDDSNALHPSSNHTNFDSNSVENFISTLNMLHHPNSIPIQTTLQIPDTQCNSINVNEGGKLSKINNANIFVNPTPLTTESIDLYNIFNQISSVDETNIITALRASQKCLDIFLKDIRRLENNLMRNPPLMDLSQVAYSFQGIYKFHLFTRLGNLISRIQEEEELINKTSQVNRLQTVPFHPVGLLSQSNVIPVSIPILTNSTDVTIDLTNEDTITSIVCKPDTSKMEAVSSISTEMFPKSIDTVQSTTLVSEDDDNDDYDSNCDKNNNNNNNKRKPVESKSQNKTDNGKRRKLDIIESNNQNPEDQLSDEKSSEEQELEREVHNMERVYTRSITHLTEQVNGYKKELDEVNENTEERDKHIQNTTNKNTAGQRKNPRCKTTNQELDGFEDDSWSIEDNLNSSLNNIDANFDGSESNDHLIYGDDDTASEMKISRQNQLDSKTNDYLQNLNARDDLLKSSSDENDSDNVGDIVSDEKVIGSSKSEKQTSDNSNQLINATTTTTNDNNNADIDGTFDHDHSLTGNLNDSHEETPLVTDSETSIGASYPVVHLTRLIKAALNQNMNDDDDDDGKVIKARCSTLDDTSGAAAAATADNDDDNENTDDKDSQSEFRSNGKDIVSSRNSNSHQKMRRLPSSSESDDNKHNNDDESKQGFSNESSDSEPLKVRRKGSTSHRTMRSQRRLSNKSAVRHSDNDYEGGLSLSNVSSNSEPSKVKQKKLTSHRTMRSRRRASNKSAVCHSDNDGDDNDDTVDHHDNDTEKEEEKKGKVKLEDFSSSSDEMDNIDRRRKPCHKRRRRRLRKENSDDDNGEDEQKDNLKDEKNKQQNDEQENDDTLDAKGRKKIRRIYNNNRLSETTKAAEASEQERRRRLAERQKMYNDFIVQDGEGINAVTTKLILDPGDPVVEVHPDILKHLKPHQVEAVRFLWDCTIESVEHQKSGNESSSASGNGAILAHCMGLGKTLSVISFLHTLLRYPEQLNIRTGLIICPVNTLLNWKHEWEIWSPEDEPTDVFELASKNSNRLKLDIIKHWHKKGGILLIGYDMFRNFVMTLMKRTKSKGVRNTISSSLLNPGPDIVVCDEGHLMKNAKSHIAKAVSQIRTSKRVILTGTPLQNNLNEYHAMVDFVKPNLLGTLKEFNNRFVNPIKNGQHSNSTPRDVNVMKKRAHILYKTLDGCVQRKDYSVLTKYLPPRYEYVIMCRLTEVQQDLYAYFLENLDNLDSIHQKS